MTYQLNVRIPQQVAGQVEELKNKYNVPASHVWRGMIMQGAQIMKEKCPEELQRYYETVATQMRISTIKEQTQLLRSNAYFVRRSARMILELLQIDKERADELHELLLEEAEIRGVREEFVKKIRGEIAQQEELEKLRNDNPEIRNGN